MRRITMERVLRKRTRWIMIGILAIVVSVGVFMPVPAHADDDYWIGGSGNWSEETNWSLYYPIPRIPTALPIQGDIAYLNDPGNTVTLDTVTLASWIQLACNLELSDSGNGILGSGFYINSGGIFTQTNGTSNLGFLHIWNGGSCNLGGASSTMSSIMIEDIGGTGLGTFNQTGGSNTAQEGLAVGCPSSGNGDGTYNLSGGTLTVETNDPEVVGCGSGIGTFIQTSGIHIVKNCLNVAMDAGSIGAFTLSGDPALSTLTVTGNLDIGGGGTGTFTQTGGSTSTDNLIIGLEGNGMYNLSTTTGASILTVNGVEDIAHAGTGIITQTGGVHIINGNVSLGTNGTFNLYGGTLTVNESLNQNGQVLNNGTFQAKNTTAHFNGPGGFINNSAIICEPSATIYFTDLTVETNGYLQGAGTEFFINRNLYNSSPQSMYSHSQGTLLTFSGEGPHEIRVFSAERGASMSGYANNYALRDIKILSTTVSIVGYSLYLEGLVGAAISGDTVTNITGNGYNVYYISTLPMNAYLNKKTYSLMNGGQLIPIDPTCECDLNADGRCNMSDWLLFGQRWGATNCNTVPCACDLNADGRCNMSDWLLFGKNWGRTDCPRP